MHINICGKDLATQPESSATVLCCWGLLRLISEPAQNKQLPLCDTMMQQGTRTNKVIRRKRTRANKVEDVTRGSESANNTLGTLCLQLMASNLWETALNPRDRGDLLWFDLMHQVATCCAFSSHVLVAWLSHWTSFCDYVARDLINTLSEVASAHGRRC